MTELESILNDSEAAQRMAYTSGARLGAMQANQAWEQRAKEQEAVTAAVRMRIVALEEQVQGLTMELVEALDALDTCGGRRVVVQPPPNRPVGEAPGDQSQPTSVADGLSGGSHGQPAGTETDDDGLTHGTGEHFDGEEIQ